MVRSLFRVCAALLIAWGVAGTATAQKSKQAGADSDVVRAAQEGDAAALAAALGRGGSPTATDAAGGSALLWAAYGGHLGAAQRLVEAGAPTEERRSFIWVNEATGFYLSGPLNAAVAGGHLPLARYLVEEAGADLDAASWNPHMDALLGWTALQWAVVAGNLGAVTFLLEAGASPDEAPAGSLPPLAMALQGGQFLVVAALRGAGADMDIAQAHLPRPLAADTAQAATLTVHHPLDDLGAHTAAFTFEPTGTAPFALAVTTEAFRPQVFAVSPSQVVYFNDGWPGAAGEARIVVSEPESGTWQVRVGSGEAGQTGAFDVAHRALSKAEARAMQATLAEVARADSLVQVVLAALDADRAADAVAAAEEETALREALYGPAHPTRARSYVLLADAYQAARRYDEADARYAQAIDAGTVVFGAAHQEVAITKTKRAALLSERGRYAEAAALLEEARDVFEAAVQSEEAQEGSADPETVLWLARVLDALGVVVAEQGRIDEAMPLGERALALREATLGPGDPAVAASLGNLAARRASLGDYEAAIDLATRALAIQEAALGPDDLDAAITLGKLATYYDALGDLARAEVLHRRALAVTEAAGGPDHPDQAMRLGNLAGVLAAQGRYAEAGPLYTRALDRAEMALGPDHVGTATALNNLAAFYRQQSRYAEAEPLYRRALAIREAALGPDHPDVATGLGNLGFLLQEQGRYAEAEPLYRRGLALYEAAYPPSHPDVALGLTNLAGVLDATGRYAEAEPLYERALAIRRTAFGDAHPAVAQSQGNLATFYQAQGRYAEAEPLLMQALATTEAALGPAHPDVAVALGNLAALYQAQGRYAEAEIRFERTLQTYEAALGPDHPDVAVALGNLEALYTTQGRFAEAEPLARRALAIREAAFGPAHPDVALALSNLGTVRALQQDDAEAAQYERRALALREAALGPDHPDVATSLNNLAVYVGALGDRGEAAALLRRAVGIVEARFGPTHPDVALFSENLAGELAQQGQTAEARALLERALAVRTRALGPTHPALVYTLLSLADLDVVDGRLAEANDRFAQAVTLEQEVIDTLLPYATEREQQAFLRLRLPLGVLLSAALLPETEAQAARVETAFAHLLQRKALRLDVQAARLRAVRATAGADTTTVRLFGSLRSVGQRIAQVTFAGPGGEPPEAYRARLDTLRARRTLLEDRLARVSAAALDRPAPTDPTAFASALAEGERLVEYVRFRPYDFGARADSLLWQPARYVAFVLGDAPPVPGSAPSAQDDAIRFVDLGPAAPIDSLVARFRTQVVAPQRMGRAQQRRARAAFDATARALYDRLVAPLSLDGARALRIAPDGALHTLPFEALRDGTGAFLTETRRVSYLTSSRALLRPATAALPSDTLVVFAAVDYDAAVVEAETMAGATNEAVAEVATDAAAYAVPGGTSASAVGTVGVAARAQRGGSFAALPGTAAEAAMLDALGMPMRTYLGRAATEARLLALAAPGRLHIATHGFFLDSEAAASALVGERSGGLSGTLGGGTVSPDEEGRFADPLLRAGLALAGANRVGTVTDDVTGGATGDPVLDGGVPTDGIATAYELAAVDLRGTDLVVLSACETGLGEVEAGEGVLGLRRAFEMAGAETVVMSLWKVPDDATAALMGAFYGALAEGQGKAEALRAAAATVRAEERWAHPYWWAAFVLAGGAE